MRTCWTYLAVAVSVAACSASPADEGATGAGGQAATTGSTSATTSAGGGSGVGGSFTTSSGSGGGDSGCRKADFLFVIDNSSSMQNEQAALIQSFPGFISAIEAAIPANGDFHVMVNDTDGCPSGMGCACDDAVGAGVVHPTGANSSNQVCPIQGGKRYMVQGEPDLSGTFACVAQVGTAGSSSERPMDALVAAMSSTLNGPGGCNEGFLRDDAILVVTFISDDPNYEDAGTPQDWYDAVVAAKGGKPESVVVLGLTPNFDGCQDGKGPPKGAHWSEFIAKWGAHGLEENVCSPDYTPFFQKAVGIIDETCADFTPPS